MEMVNRKLENYPQTIVDSDTGDGEQTIFRLSHEFIVEGSLTCEIDDVATTAYTVDLDTGFWAATAAPADAAAIVWKYQTKHWSDEDVGSSLQDAIHDVFPAFYVTDLYASLSTTSGTYEYTLPDLTEEVTAVEWRSGSTSPWTRLKHYRWDIRRDGTTAYLQFHDNPAAGSLRVGLVKRAEPFTALSETLNDVGLPGTAVKPLVLYACWDLLNQKFSVRVRLDEAVATQGEGVSPPDQFQRAITAFRYAYDASLVKNRMKPWSVR